MIGAAPLLAGPLAVAPGLVVLATSRAVLRLSGEHEFAVPPLPVPPAGADLDPGQLRRYASVSLFAERAHAAALDFELTSGNAAAVAEICRRLDGLPLAIELAAARVRLLPPPALLSRLDHRFSLLTGGARDLPERQQALRNTLDWSFGLLTAGEQALFARLGVFAGSFSLPAPEAIGTKSPEGGQALLLRSRAAHFGLLPLADAGGRGQCVTVWQFRRHLSVPRRRLPPRLFRRRSWVRRGLRPALRG